MAARIPSAFEAGLGQVTARPGPQLPAATQNIATNEDMFGGAQGKLLQPPGQSIERNALQLAAIEKQDAALEATDLETQAQKEIMRMFYNEQDGLLNAQGQSALNVPGLYRQKMDDLKKRYLGMTKNPVTQGLLGRALDNIDLTGEEAALKHTHRERMSYASEVAGANAAAAQEQTALAYNDDDVFYASLEKVRAAATVQAGLDGLKPGNPAFDRRIKDAVSGTYAARLRTMIESEDPEMIRQASALYEKGGEQMNLSDRMAVDGQLDAVLPKLNAQAKFQEFMGNHALDSLPIDYIFNNGQLMVESGNRQFDKSGAPIVSSAGAIGIAQIMVDTGPEAAVLAGLPWSEFKLATDEKYNKALGQAYLVNLYNRYENNGMALLAYNWGMGNVDKHIKRVGDPRKGEISMQDFLAKVPSKEAREYVPKVMAEVRKATGMGVNLSAAMEFSDSLPEKERDYFMSDVLQMNSRIETAQRDESNIVLQQVQSVLEQENGNINLIPPSLRAKAQSLGLWTKITEFKGKSDPVALANFEAMNSDDLLNVDFNDPAVQQSLSAQDFAKYQKKQKDMISDPASRALEKRVDGALSYLYGREYKVDAQAAESSTAKAYAKDKQRLGRIREQVRYEIQNVFENTGKVPSENEVADMVDRMLMSRRISYDPPGWFNNVVVPDVFDLEVSDIPEDVRTNIEAALKRNGKTATPASTLNLYRLYLLQKQASDGQ